jgi:hypothetical protein
LGETVLSNTFAMARIASTTENDLLQEVSALTGWDHGDLALLTGTQGFGFPFPTAYKDERALRRVRNAFLALKRLGVAASQVLVPPTGAANAWISPDVTALAARSIKQAVRAKYGDDEWLAVAKPLKDALREKQRSALVSFLVFALGKNDSNDLFAHFLGDVEMGACAVTSRIKQASGSVQLFVQRCLLGLEKDAAGNAISLSEEAARQWKWRKNYRVWEANRKIFLYPENWIEPDLRDDKSLFFRDLENQLLQNEITADTAEAAFLAYLDKLEGAARLEVVGMYHQVEGTPKLVSATELDLPPSEMAHVTLDVLHVFGRTQGTPRAYYYRRRVGSSRTSYRWTPWEKVDLDIEGDHLIPVVWNRRLHLLWPVFIEKAKDEPPPQKDQDPHAPQKYWTVQMAWSEYKDGIWAAKKVTEKPLSLDATSAIGDVGLVPKELFTFKAFSGEMLRVCLYFKKGSGDVSTNGQSFSVEAMGPIAQFVFMGCGGSTLIAASEGDIAWSPAGTAWRNMIFIEWTSASDWLYMPQAISTAKNVLNGSQHIPVLKRTPGTFRLLTAHQDRHFVSQRPFFFEDDRRTLLTLPADAVVNLLSYFVAKEAADFITIHL